MSYIKEMWWDTCVCVECGGGRSIEGCAICAGCDEKVAGNEDNEV